jgi:acyl carrier protein
MASTHEIEVWLVERIKLHLAKSDEAIDPHLPFSYYGLDSLDAVALAAELETWLGIEVAPDVAWDYPTVHAVASYLAGDDQVEGVDPNVDALLAEIDDQTPSNSASGPTMK